jgi:hypothetical protein
VVEEEDEGLTYLDLLPPAALRCVASYLTPTEVLDTLLPVCPSRFADLRNGVAFDHLDDRNSLEHVRHLVLASSDAVKRLRINYKPLRGPFVSKWLRVAGGKRLKTLVIQDPELVRGLLLSPSIKELQFDMTDPPVDYRLMNAKNWWEEYQPASPAPVAESVVVEYGEQETTFFVKDDCVWYVASLHRGDSFFKAFPHASKLSFLPEPNEAFFDQPPHVLANVRELLFSHKPVPSMEVQNSVFPYLTRFENLELLTVSDDFTTEFMAMLPQDYVHNSLRTLNILNMSQLFKKESVWHAIPRQFPKLRTLRVKLDVVCSVDWDRVEPSVLTDLIPKHFKHLENLELIFLPMPLDTVLEMVLRMLWKTPVKIRSVVCQGLSEEVLVLTRGQTDMIRKLREMPDCHVDFRLTNGVGDEFECDGGFYFAFQRS